MGALVSFFPPRSQTETFAFGALGAILEELRNNTCAQAQNCGTVGKLKRPFLVLSAQVLREQGLWSTVCFS